jgi:hypothetical protein
MMRMLMAGTLRFAHPTSTSVYVVIPKWIPGLRLAAHPGMTI